MFFPFAVFFTMVPADDARVLRVPDEYPSIQTAIDASPSRHVVLVAPGRYRECLDLQGKVITVRSEAGPDATSITGEARARRSA